jgi:hypothetical protein
LFQWKLRKLIPIKIIGHMDTVNGRVHVLSFLGWPDEFSFNIQVKDSIKGSGDLEVDEMIALWDEKYSEKNTNYHINREKPGHYYEYYDAAPSELNNFKMSKFDLQVKKDLLNLDIFINPTKRRCGYGCNHEDGSKNEIKYCDVCHENWAHMVCLEGDINIESSDPNAITWFCGSCDFQFSMENYL